MNTEEMTKSENVDTAPIADMESTLNPAKNESFDETEVRNWLVTCLSKLLDVPSDKIRTDASFYKLGLDSVAAVAITADLEKWVGKPLSPTLTADHQTIDEVAAYISKEVA